MKVVDQVKIQVKPLVMTRAFLLALSDNDCAQMGNDIAKMLVAQIRHERSKLLREAMGGTVLDRLGA